MSDTVALDVMSVLEKAQPSVEEIEQVRRSVCADPNPRKKVVALISSLPAHPDAGRQDKALALRKGLALWAVGREVEAAAWLHHSSARAAKVFRARALTATGRPAEAVKLLEGAADDGGAAAAAAEAYANLGDADAARKLLGTVESAGNKAEAAYLRGRLADLDGEHDAAMDAYRQAIAVDPQHALALFRLAYDEHLFGDEEDAAATYRRCVDTPCPPVNAYLNLGNLYEDRGEFTKARDCYASVLEVDPVNSRAHMFERDAAASLNMFYDEDLERRADKRSQVLRLPVTDFELSVRSRNCLAKMGVRTLGDLIQRTEAELLSYKNFGETSLQEIKDILAQKSLRLGMGREEVAQDEQARSILEGIGVGDADRRKLLQKPLGELELSVRSRHCMNVLGLKTVGELIAKSEAELMTIKNFGQTSLNEVKQKLAELSLTLAPGPAVGEGGVEIPEDADVSDLLAVAAEEEDEEDEDEDEVDSED